jgi:hypothetical protein
VHRLAKIVCLSFLFPSVTLAYSALNTDDGFGTNPVEPATSLTTYGQIALIYSPDKNIDLGLSYQRNAPSFEVSLGGAGAYTSRIQAGVTYRFD